MYDNQIGRWNHIDPESDRYFTISPYAYVNNNPMYFVDPTGAYIVIHSKQKVKNADGEEVEVDFSVVYEDGKTYTYSENKDGSITKGEEYKGDNEFVKHTVTALDYLNNNNAMEMDLGSGQVNLLTTMMNDKQYRVNIVSSVGQKRSDSHTFTHDGKNGTIGFNPLAMLQFYNTKEKNF